MRSATPQEKNVLIAEDEPSIVISLEFLLRNAGYAVSVARNGADALRRAYELRPDLVVLDIMLPLMDGFEVCRQLREDPALAHTRILMLTARGQSSEIEKGLALGADAFMTKPFATRDLVAAVRELLAAPAA